MTALAFTSSSTVQLHAQHLPSCDQPAEVPPKRLALRPPSRSTLVVVECKWNARGDHNIALSTASGQPRGAA